MKERILETLGESGAPMAAAALAEALAADPAALRDALEALERAGRVVQTRRGGYALPASVGLMAARAAFQRNGTPMAHPLDGGAAVAFDVVGGERCLPDDLILVRTDGPRPRLNAILQRGMDSFPAYLRVEGRPSGGRRRGGPRASVGAIPCDPRIPYAVALTGDLSGARNDEIALLKIEEYPAFSRPIRASVARVLGPSDSMPALLRAVAESHGFATEQPEDVADEAADVPEAVRLEDLAGREDLRGLPLFTIDGATAKDFDDAVSIRRTPKGWRLGVHIADVSHYVRPGTAIDADARRRGTSLYLPGLTVPMLPEALSNHLCSLMPEVDRLALSLLMDIEGGRIADHRLVRSVVHSRARLTYAAVNRLFETGDPGDLAPEVRDALLDMRALARDLRARRQAAGAIDLDIDEPEFVLDERGEAADVLCAPRGEAERLIESFMLAANETVAALARGTELPFVYRVHEPPDAARLRGLEAFLSSLGLRARIGADPHPGALQAILDRTRDHPAQDLIRRHMLRALKRARYSDAPLGHYALAMRDYCHFTSPIRRYPDLVVHRMLKLLIDGALDRAASQAGRMAELAEDCSERENAATLAERQGDGIMMASYMSRRIGERFDGVISGVTGWGLYVTLPNQAEGLVHIARLEGDYYTYDRERERLVGSATGAVFRLGDRVRVRVESVSVPLGEINFELLPARRGAAAD